MRGRYQQKDLFGIVRLPQQDNAKPKRSRMKRSRKSVRTKATAIPELRFEDQRLTSFAGLVVIQRFFQVIFFKTRLQKCFRHLSQGKIFDRATIFTITRCITRDRHREENYPWDRCRRMSSQQLKPTLTSCFPAYLSSTGRTDSLLQLGNLHLPRVDSLCSVPLPLRT